jgi:hypothetical protein
MTHSPDSPAAAPTTPTELQELRRHRAADYPPDPLPEIIPGGGISLIAGASGIGKTAFLAWWATRFRDHSTIFGHQTTKVPEQVILAVDRSWIQSTSRWFEAVGYPEIRAYSPLDDATFRPSQMRRKDRRIDMLKAFLDKLNPIAPHTLVYVDPIAPFLGGNLNDYDSCATACMEIREIARERRLTIIGTAHTAKLKADPKDRYARAQDRILGSAAILGYTDTQMYLAAPEETGHNYYEFLWNPHHAPKAVYQLDRDPKTGLFIPPGESPRQEEQHVILAFLDQQPDGMARFVEILAAIALPKATLHRHLQVLVKDGLVVSPAKGMYARVKVN